MITPPALLPGDLIEIVAPAKAIEAEHVYFTQKYLENCGFKVRISPNCLRQHHYFSGTIEERLSDFQHALDDTEVKAILCARGGYGCVQIIDGLNWNTFINQPKWIIGFSDVTVFHQHLSRMGIESIHGTMPLNFSTNSKAALSTLIEALSVHSYAITSKAHPNNIEGLATGRLLGGNLSILFGLIGTNSEPDYTNSILFIEDLAEHIYHIDRMFYALKKAGILDKINGLAVGGMTDLKDTVTPFGKTYEEVICSHLAPFEVPVCFGLPAGHIDDNQALIIGRRVEFVVSSEGAELRFIKS